MTPQHSYPLVYQEFLEVARVLGAPPGNAKLAVENLRKALLKSKGAERLRKEFYYLRTAVESVYSQALPTGALAFRVFAEYRRRTLSRTQMDLIMQEQEQLL